MIRKSRDSASIVRVPLAASKANSLEKTLQRRAAEMAISSRDCRETPRPSAATMRVGKLCKAANVGLQTVRYYQRIGLLRKPPRPFEGYRAYSSDDLARLRFIRHAQRLGFSLEDVALLLRLTRDDCDDAQSLARHKLDIVRHKIASLDRIATVLEAIVVRCRSRGKYRGCPIIETLTTTD